MASKQVAPVESNPSWLVPQGQQSEIAAPLVTGTPYVSFVSSKAPTFPGILAQVPALQDGDPVLFEAGQPTLLAPMRFYYHGIAFQHYSKVNAKGEILEATQDTQEAEEHNKTASDNDKYREHVEAVLLLMLPDRVLPCRCTFKTVKTSAFHAANKALQEAAGPRWKDRGVDFAASLQAPHPWLRFCTMVKIRRGTSRGNGNPFAAADGIIQAATVADWTLLRALFEKGSAALEKVVDDHNERVEKVRECME